MSTSILTALAVSVILGAPAAQTSLLDSWRWLPVTPTDLLAIEKREAGRAAATQKDQVRRAGLRRVEAFSDRSVYLAGDEVASLVIDATAFSPWEPGAALTVELVRDTVVIAQRSFVLDAKATGKLAIAVPSDGLPTGKYAVRARVDPAIGQPGEWRFTRSSTKSAGGTIPVAGVPLVVHGMEGASAWPISTGVPMPRGAIRTPADLVLLENGRPIPAQWTVRSRWSPRPDSAPAWLGLDFLAKPQSAYRIARGKPAVARRPLKLSETSDEITIDTGPAKLVIRKHGFDGLHAAWVDADKNGVFAPSEARVSGGGGLELIDETGALHRALADRDVVVKVEESGPVRAVISASGWYVAESAPRLCRFVVQFTAYAGVAALFASTHTIIAHDTRVHHIADLRLRIPVIGGERWSTGHDGAVVEGPLPDAPATAWLHQERADALRVMVGEKPLATGVHADGWMAIRSAKSAVSVTLRDTWQKFPKELEAGTGGIDVHFWPRHGRRTFNDEEELDPRHVFEARFAHQGPLLDLQMPKRYFDALAASNEASKWDVENTATIGYRSSAEGVSIGNELAIWLDAPDDGAVARTFQAPPHAIASPSWNVATGVETSMSARDDARWPLAERTLNHDFPRAMLAVIDHVGAYGMWIYANTFNTWRNGWPGLHRVWQNSHYQQVGDSWKLYFRGGSPELYRWATAQSALFADVATVHHVLPELEVPGRQLGAMYHAKGFLPWGARQKGEFPTDGDVRNWGHFIDPDAYLWRYLLTGDLFARDLYRQWLDTIGRATFPVKGNGREAVNDLAMLLAAYRFTWDPALIPAIRRGGESMLAVPLTQGKATPSYPVWNKRWPDRYWDLTRDDRIIGAVDAYTRAGFAHAAPASFVYRHTGEGLPDALLPVAYDLPRLVYRDEGSPLDGFASYVSAREEEELMQLPEYLAALTRAGLSERAAPAMSSTDLPGVVLATNPEGKSFHLRVTTARGAPRNDPRGLLVRAPSGKILKKIVITAEPRMPAADAAVTISLSRGTPSVVVEVRTDGEKGVYRIERFGYAASFELPMTDLAHEAIALTQGVQLRTYGRVEGVLVRPPGSSAAIALRAEAKGSVATRVPAVVYARIGSLLDQTFYDNGDRRSAEVEIPAGTTQPLVLLGDAVLTWRGEGALYLARTAKDVAAVLRE